jgi:asparaginyl-tRNA synthetase
MALGQIYTFDLRLEPKTQILVTLLIWMIEPEVAFNDLNDNMDLAEDFIQYVINTRLTNVRGFEILEGRF